MNKDRILEALAILEAEMPKSGALLGQERIFKFGTTIIKGNQTGLFKLAIEALNCGLNEETPKLKIEDIVENPLIDVSASDSDCLALQRLDSIEKKEKNENETDSKPHIGLTILGYSFMFSFMTVLLVGAYTSFRWLIDLF